MNFENRVVPNLPALGVGAAISSLVVLVEATGVAYPRIRTVHGAALLTLHKEGRCMGVKAE